MSKLLVSVILAACPGYDVDKKGQFTTNECQEWFVNCAVGKKGEVTEDSTLRCLEKYEKQFGGNSVN